MLALLRQLSHSSLPVSSANRFQIGLALLLALAAPVAVNAQAGHSAPSAFPTDRVSSEVDLSQLQTLPRLHPQWASTANDLGAVDPETALPLMTLVLARSPQQEQALTSLLAGQQNPASPDYHHWLTPAQFGQRFGLTEHDTAAISTWLQSQGLHVAWVAPSRTFIGFTGSASDMGRAFHTSFHHYQVNGTPRLSVAIDPQIPSAIAPAIKAIRGFYEIKDQPLLHARAGHSDAPAVTTGSGNHYLAPEDFNTIYDVPNGAAGTGQTIGIVGRSRTDFADFDNLRKLTQATFANPTEVVPTTFGGVDPGPAYTTPPANNVDLGDQLEAELDVLRAGSVAPNANLLLVTATDDSGGIAADALYLTQTYPLPAQVMNVSFGACESYAGSDNVTYWDSIFEQAAAEGISSFVASGDAGAAGCDDYFDTPPASPDAISPNYICSSSHATCVGGTEFNDTAEPSKYWIQANGPDLNSAIGYIPEGAWNEPLSYNSTTQAAASGGGVSSYIATPAWQAGTGVPAARAGRYTPDIAFSSSGHDGYFACFAAAGASCVATNGSYNFEYFFGTSAAAPSMAGVAALLDQNLGGLQGNLNPEIYAMATAAPTAFHDVTVTTSGVSGCTLNTPSMCNNSLPGAASLTGGETGYLVTKGYDEVTGLGSLDVSNFLTSYAAPAAIQVSASYLILPNSYVGSTATAQLTVTNGGGSPLDPATISLVQQSGATFAETDNCNATLAAGASCTVNISFIATVASLYVENLTLASANAAEPSVQIFLQAQAFAVNTTVFSPTVTVTPAASTVNVTQPLAVTISVAPGAGEALPTGSISLTGGGYTSGFTTLSNGAGTITIPANSLAVGTDTITGIYSPDAAGSILYDGSSGQATVTVTSAPVFALSTAVPSLTLKAGADTGNTVLVTATPTGSFTGVISLSAAITAAPPSDTYPPQIAFISPGTVDITSANPVGLAFTVTTTAPSSPGCDTEAKPGRQVALRTLAGQVGAPIVGAVLGCVLLLAIPARRRAWRSMLGLALLLVAFSTGLTACGGSGSQTKCPSVLLPGTTTGTYTITITGTAPGLSETTTMTLTVQ